MGGDTCPMEFQPHLCRAMDKVRIVRTISHMIRLGVDIPCRALTILVWVGTLRKISFHWYCHPAAGNDINRGYYTVARRYGYYFRVVNAIFYERAQRVSKILFSTRENNIHIFKLPCNVLFIIWSEQAIGEHINFILYI